MSDAGKLERDPWSTFRVFIPLLQSTIQASAVLAVAFFVTGRIEANLKERELGLAEIEKMRGLIDSLIDRDTPATAAEESAATLSTYGVPAIGPLLTALTMRSDGVRDRAAAQALAVIGLTSPVEVCDASLRLIRIHREHFPWRAYRAAVRLVGETGCRRGGPTLSSLHRRISSSDLDSVADQFAPSPPFNAEARMQLQDAINNSLRDIGQPAARGGANATGSP